MMRLIKTVWEKRTDGYYEETILEIVEVDDNFIIDLERW